ncbi:MAG: hypothetical protein O7E57_16050, partial [Gammaproteobacteria bacterium]|nr:hypothetical protein [Gammaproteobacteria bacterium]
MFRAGVTERRIGRINTGRGAVISLAALNAGCNLNSLTAISGLVIALTFSHVVRADETLTTIDSARLIVTDNVEIPAMQALGWHNVSLTDRWPLSRYDTGRQGW